MKLDPFLRFSGGFSITPDIWTQVRAATLALTLSLACCSEEKSAGTKKETGAKSDSPNPPRVENKIASPSVEMVALKPSITNQSTAPSRRLPPELSAKDPRIQSLIKRFADARGEDRERIVNEILLNDTAEGVAGALELSQGLPPSELKTIICQKLSGIETRGKRDFLLGALAYVDSDLQRALAHALGTQADAELVGVLIDRYDNQPNEEVRASTLMVLRDSVVPEATELLTAVVNDPTNGVSEPLVRAASEALAKGGTTPGVAALIRKLESSAGNDQKVLSDLVASISAPAAHSGLLFSAKGNKESKSAAARVASLKALSNYPTMETLQFVRPLMADPDVQIQTAARDLVNKIERIVGR
jgi:HEAT repeat protein